MKELGEVVPGADSAPKPVSNNPTISGTAVPPPPSLVSLLSICVLLDYKLLVLIVLVSTFYIHKIKYLQKQLIIHYIVLLDCSLTCCVFAF